MYAIVDIAGQQFKVEKEQKIFVNRLNIDEGKKVEFDRVMLIDDDGKVNIGSPVIKGASVSAQVLSHVRGDKVLVFKKKRRKGYQKLNGHRQDLSELLIEGINEKTTSKKKAADKVTKETKPEEPKESKPTAAEEKTEQKTEKQAEKKETKASAEPKKAEATKKEEKPAAESTESKKSETAQPEVKAEEAKKEGKKAAETKKKAEAKGETKPAAEEKKKEDTDKENKKEE